MNDEKATSEFTHEETNAALERFVVDNDELLELEEPDLPPFYVPAVMRV